MIDNKGLKTLIKHLIFSDKVINQADFASKLGYERSTISGMTSGKKPISESFANKVCETFEVNIDWLRTGEGEMLKDDNLPMINYERRGIPYYNVDFLCGFDLTINDQTANPDYYIDFKQYSKADFWVNASGDSMRPTINPGDILAVRQLPDDDWSDHIMYGEVYAIVTTQNRTIKKIRKSTLGNDYLRLIPENLAEYDEQDIKADAIVRVFQVLGCMKKLI